MGQNYSNKYMNVYEYTNYIQVGENMKWNNEEIINPNHLEDITLTV